MSNTPTPTQTSYTATNFYNDELNRLHKKQQNADEILNAQERLALLNDSYRKRYAKYVQMLMVLVCSILVYLGIILLQKQFPAIPQVAIDILTIILMFLVIFYLFMAVSELYSRSLLNYDELDLPSYDASGIDISDLASKGQIFDYQSKGNVCIGAECCPQSMNYDSAQNICVMPTATSPVPSSSRTPTKGANFTTLEYENIKTAYTDMNFDNPSLKRSPNNQDVKPLHYTTILNFSHV
jgi:hypothetical protein